MKTIKIYQIAVLLFIFTSSVMAQEIAKPHENKKGELSLETNSGKLFQGAFIGAATYYTIQEFGTLKEEWQWLKIPISILTSYLFEITANSKKTTTEKQLFVATGALSVTVTIELFKGRR